MLLDYQKLHNLENAFIMYEISSSGIDPRDTLDNTTLRIYSKEGYKQRVYDKYHELILKGAPYTKTIMAAFPGVNLVNYHEKPELERIINTKGDRFEMALASLYEGNDDETAFKQIVDVVGGRFDILAFLFFLKDCEKYLPIRSKTFDDRFSTIDVASHLDGNCKWEKYAEFNETIKAIQKDLIHNINSNITLLDAHSFVWVLNGIAEYLDNKVQLVEHKKFGKGTVEGFKDDYIVVKFGKEKKLFNKDSAFSEGYLRFVNVGFDIDGPNQKPEDEEDKRLISDLKQSSWKAPKDFKYIGGKKEKPKPILKDGQISYPRDRMTAVNALAHARFKCEIDNAHLTFIKKSTGKPYTEPHHLVPIAFTDRFDVSLDREENIVSLCSNCHNEIHYGRDAKALIKKLYLERKELLHSVGIDISLEKLLEMYGEN